jgi:hypothetical protein
VFLKWNHSAELIERVSRLHEAASVIVRAYRHHVDERERLKHIADVRERNRKAAEATAAAAASARAVLTVAEQREREESTRDVAVTDSAQSEPYYELASGLRVDEDDDDHATTNHGELHNELAFLFHLRGSQPLFSLGAVTLQQLTSAHFPLLTLDDGSVRSAVQRGLVLDTVAEVDEVDDGGVSQAEVPVWGAASVMGK